MMWTKMTSVTLEAPLGFEPEDELLQWADVCKNHTTLPTLPLTKDSKTKISMMLERFNRYSVILAGQLDHPQLRSMALMPIALHHLNEGKPLTSSEAAARWSCVPEENDATALGALIEKDRLPHWRFIAWWETEHRMAKDPLLEKFAWLAGAQAAMNILIASTESTGPGWGQDAVMMWCRIAVLLGKNHRYLTDDSWNERFLETQWRGKLKDGFTSTLDALLLGSGSV